MLLLSIQVYGSLLIIIIVYKNPNLTGLVTRRKTKRGKGENSYDSRVLGGVTNSVPFACGNYPDPELTNGTRTIVVFFTKGSARSHQRL